MARGSKGLRGSPTPAGHGSGPGRSNVSAHGSADGKPGRDPAQAGSGQLRPPEGPSGGRVHVDPTYHLWGGQL